MKSGIAIVEIWEKRHIILPEHAKEFLVSLIEAGLQEAYEQGKQDCIKMAERIAKGATR